MQNQYYINTFLFFESIKILFCLHFLCDSMPSVVGDEKADGEMFSTTDKDNDQAKSNCAAQGRGGCDMGNVQRIRQ